MIDREVIVKSIDNAIVKCSSKLRVGSYTLNNQVKNTINNFAIFSNCIFYLNKLVPQH